MTYSSFRKQFNILVLSIVFSSFALSQSKSDFALSLMRERDYFRAISIYKEMLYFSSNPDSSAYFTGQIAKAYRLSQKYPTSVSTYLTLLNSSTLSDSARSSAYIGLGLNYLSMNVPGQAIPYFKEAQKNDKECYSTFYLGLVSAEMSDWETAIKYYDEVIRTSPLPELKTLSAGFTSTLDKAGEIPHKSPFAASLMSAIIPGSGQFYSDHPIDGIQAFAFVASFAFASYLAYQNDHQNNSNYLLTGISFSITGLFHLANILGAERTATYYNQRQRDLFVQDIRQRSYDLQR